MTIQPSQVMTKLLRRWRLAAHIAIRIVRSRRSRRLSAVTIISILGVAFGVLALTAVLGVTGGFQKAFQERILGLYPHMVVLQRIGDFQAYEPLVDRLSEVSEVAGVTPATFDDMMAACGARRSGTIVKGIDLDTVDSVLPIRQLIQQGDLDSLAEDPQVRRRGDRVEVQGLVAASWLTVTLGPDGALKVLEDDPTPPGPDQVRVQVLDMRQRADPVALTLTPASSEGASRPGDIGLDANGPRTLGPVEPGRLSPSTEVRAGTWRLDITGERIVFEPETRVTLLLMDGDGEGTTQTRVMVGRGRAAVPERHGMVRLVHAQPGAGPVHLEDPQGASQPPVRPGEFSRYMPMPGRLPGIVLGRDLARRLEAEVGDEITLVTPLRGVDQRMLGTSSATPSSTRHVVSGVFESGFYEYDVRLALVGIEAAQRFLNRGRVIRWLEVRADDLMRVEEVRRRVAASLDPFDFETVVRHSQELSRKIARIADGAVSGTSLRDPVGMIDQIDNAAKTVRLLKYQDLDFGYHPRFRLIDWQEMNTNLLGALKLQKVVLTIFFLIIIVVGSFVVVGSQIMVIHEKIPDIVILKAMGCTRQTIRLAFTLQGLLVASIGTAVGLGVGAGLVALLGVIDYPLDASVYLIDHLPVRLDTLDLLLIAGATGVCTVIATQYSAGKAAAQTVVDGLRSLG